MAAIPLAGVAVATAYPTAVVTMVVPYPAGTATDGFGRIFARHLQSQLGQRFLVANRPGANGMNGTETVTRARGDGYTLLFTTNSPHTAVQFLHKKVPYDPVSALSRNAAGDCRPARRQRAGHRGRRPQHGSAD